MCDTFCVRRSDGMLFAKSSDRPIDEAQVLRWFDRRTASTSPLHTTYVAVPDVGAVALLGSQPTWMWGLEHGINEHRVAVGNEKIWSIDDPRAVPPALLGMDLVRVALERGRDAAGAVDALTSALETHGQGGSGEEHHDEPYWSSFLVVDARDGWVIETSGRTWVAQPVGEGAAISNRITLSTGWTRSSSDVEADSNWDAWRAPDAPTGIADHRLAATRACVARGSITAAREAVATLRDHGKGPWGTPGAGDPPQPPPDDVHDDWSGVTVCMHIRDYQCTTASMVAELPEDPDAPPRIWASLGTPCTGVFVPVAMFPGNDDRPPSIVLPSLLGDAATWHTFAALGRRVEEPGEQGRAALAAIREALDPLESALWEEADQLDALHAAREAWVDAAARWDRQLAAALVELEG